MGNIQYHLDKLTGPAFRKKGFATAKIIMEWELILNDPELARHTHPFKITYPQGKTTNGVLYIKAPGALAPQLQQFEPKIIEKIATYFGFRAIEKIKIIHEH